MELQVDEAAEYEGSEAAGMRDLHVLAICTIS